MSALRYVSGLLFAMAVVAGAALWLQRQSAAELRGEISLLRDDSRQLATLRAEHARLVAAQLPAAQLEAMRADHTAVFRLRAEIEKLKAETEQQARAVERTEPVMRAASEWRNAGRATPAAAVETIFWSEARGDIENLTSLLALDPAVKTQASAFLAAVPEATWAQYGSVERLVAHWMARDRSVVTMGIFDEKQIDAGHAQLGLQVQNQVGGRNQIFPLSLQRGDDGWRLAVTLGMVREAAKTLGGTLPSAR